VIFRERSLDSVGYDLINGTGRARCASRQYGIACGVKWSEAACARNKSTAKRNGTIKINQEFI
jgi:hypothetical protein